MKTVSRLSNFLIVLVMLISAIRTPATTPAIAANETPNPSTVTIAGTLQSELGCVADWMPSCEKTFLTYDAEDDVWQGIFEVTPNNDQDKKGPRYKVALNSTWDENYGLNASRGGADIPLQVATSTQVKFYYDHKTHLVTENINTLIVVASGDFQTQLGCQKDNDAGCLRSWLEDPEGDGTFTFVTHLLKKGTYRVSLAFNEDIQNTSGAPQNFTVNADGDEIYLGYDIVKKELVISTSGAPKGSRPRGGRHH